MNTHRFSFVCATAVATALVIALGAVPAAAGGATIIIINNNKPGEGFNDPTPATPVGGNTGTTLGQQRLIAFDHAAKIWGETLDSKVPIYVRAQFAELGANVLGSAGPTAGFINIPSLDGMSPGEEFPVTVYGSALADKRAGVDIRPPNPNPVADIGATFSSQANWYLGLDNRAVAPQVDLVAVVLHELAHGLNFLTFVNGANGRNAGASDANPDGGFTDIYARHVMDTTTGQRWNEMPTAAERAASATRFGRLVWDGAKVTANLPNVLVLGSPEARVTAPAAIAGPYQFGTAGFGPAVGNPNVVGNVVAALDAANGAGPATTDGCTPFTNAGAVAGNVALVERGTCGFAVKARNAASAGALAVIIYNNVANVAAGPPGMADDGGPAVTIPAISLTRADGLAILGQLASGVTASIGVDPTVRAGADPAGRARLFAPFPFNGGSSISHYDTVASRNLLMEPAINRDLTHNVKAPDDLTLELLRDIGWFADADLDGVADEADCEPQSDVRPTIVLGGRDTGVPNTMFTSGCTIADLIASVARVAENHGQFVSGVAHLVNSLTTFGVLTEQQKGTIISAAARTK